MHTHACAQVVPKKHLREFDGHELGLQEFDGRGQRPRGRKAATAARDSLAAGREERQRPRAEEEESAKEEFKGRPEEVRKKWIHEAAHVSENVDWKC